VFVADCPPYNDEIRSRRIAVQRQRWFLVPGADGLAESTQFKFILILILRSKWQKWVVSVVGEVLNLACNERRGGCCLVSRPQIDQVILVRLPRSRIGNFISFLKVCSMLSPIIIARVVTQIVAFAVLETFVCLQGVGKTLMP